MSKLYLITGFLGAGKTTLLKRMLQLFPEKRIHVIVNEFGKEGVDGELLREIGAVLDEINNGSIFCSCRLDKFEEVLQNVLKTEPEIIFVEASGLADPTNVKKILGQKEKFANVQYMGCVCLVDSVRFEKVYHTAVVIKRQLNVSDRILLNKVDLADEEQIRRTKEIINRHRPDVPVYETTFGDVEKEWILSMNGSDTPEDTPVFHNADITLRKYLLHINDNLELERLQFFLKMILEDTYRIKGFVHVKEGWYLINCVGNMFQAEPCEEKEEKQNLLVVLAGYGLPVGKAIKKAMEWYPDIVLKYEK